MTENTAPKTKRRLSRRDFLIVAGVGGASLFFGIKLVGVPWMRLKIAGFMDNASPPATLDAVPMAWFEFKPDNTVKLYIPKVEMGQGIHTTLAQIAADELELDWAQITVVHASTGQGLDDGAGTNASSSTPTMYPKLREAGATAREMIKAEAARQLNLPISDLTAEKGVIFSKTDAAKRLTYGEIVQNAKEWVVPKETPALKADSDFRYIGQPMPRVDLRAKVLGQAQYGIDVRLPGMLYGAVAHPTTVEGKLKSASVGDAESVPGVVKVVIADGFAGVVATSRPAAYDALARLKLEWDPGKAWQQEEIEAMVTPGQGEGVVIQDEGDVSSKLKADSVITGEYSTPMAFHAHLEPLNAVADVRADKVEIWTSTQSPVTVRKQVARLLNRKEEEVIVHPTYLGGGFGHKIGTRSAEEAAQLSAAVGKPVHLVYNRPEDFQNGFVRPPAHSILRATLTSDGRIDAIDHQQASGEVAFPFLPSFVGTIMGADFGAWRGGRINYAVANKRTVAWLADLPIATGWWRGLGLVPNAFAIESFIDELAYAAKLDPLEFRLKNLPEGELGERFKKALETVAEKSGWGTPAPEGRARGLAMCVDINTVVAEVAEVSVENGQIRVHKVWAAVDPGMVVNPNGAEAQTQGAIIMGLSAALYEEVTIKDGSLKPINFGGYRLLTMSAAPDVEVTFLQSGKEPFGMGEPPIGPVAPAVANAVFALTGQRIRKLPLKVGQA